MAIPSSGAISMSMFNTELGRTSNTANSSLAGGSTPAVGSLFWLANQSGSLNQTAPHAMSEWYGYTATPSPLVYFDFIGGASWSGTGTTATNLGSGGNTYNAAISGSPLYVTGACSVPEYCGALDSNASAYLLVPGTSTLYSSDFTWFVYHYMETIPTDQLAGLIWSEDSTKNFLWGYRNVGNFTSPNSPTYARIDTSATVYNSTSTGTQYNGFGGCCSSYLQLWHTASATILVKSGTSFTQYYHEPYGTLKKLWDVTISDWSIGSTSQKVAIGAKNNGTYPNDQYLYGVEMYTQALSEAQISQSAYYYLNSLLGSCC